MSKKQNLAFKDLKWFLTQPYLMKSDEYIPHLTDGDPGIQRGLVIFLKSCKELVVHLEFKLVSV